MCETSFQWEILAPCSLPDFDCSQKRKKKHIAKEINLQFLICSFQASQPASLIFCIHFHSPLYILFHRRGQRLHPLNDGQRQWWGFHTLLYHQRPLRIRWRSSSHRHHYILSISSRLHQSSWWSSSSSTPHLLFFWYHTHKSKIMTKLHRHGLPILNRPTPAWQSANRAISRCLCYYSWTVIYLKVLGIKDCYIFLVVAKSDVGGKMEVLEGCVG